MSIIRRPLRAQIREEILRRLADGRYRSGDSINEVEMARELGVSRTPLREALIGLEFEGQVESQVGKGFRFPTLTQAEILEAGPIIGLLEGLALDLTDPEALVAIGHELLLLTEEQEREDIDLSQVIRHDVQWHAVLISACPNARLLELLGKLKLGAFRVHLESGQAAALRDEWSTGHRIVAQALIDGDLDLAKRQGMINWTVGLNAILEAAFDQTAHGTDAG